MDHNAAAQMNAPERYVIGDLSQADRDEFEEHFADCSICLEEVGTMSAFAANARAVFRDRAATPVPVKPSRAWFFRWQFALPAFAAAALALFAVYQNTVTIPGLRAPQSFMPAVVLDGATRAALPRVPGGAPLRFQMAVPPAATGNRIWAEVSGDTGHVFSSGWVGVPASGEPLDVYFPIHLDPGRYAIILRAGTGGAELARNPFEITAEGPTKP
jgi:hypothetical protein